MCSFLSAIYTATGKLICEPIYTDSHSELLDFAGIRERDTTAPVQQFVKLELKPPGDEAGWFDPTKWAETVDEREIPAWFDPAARFSAFEGMREIISAAYSEGSDRLQFGRLLIVRGGSVRVMGSTVNAWAGSTVVAWDGSTVNAWAGSTVDARACSTVNARAGSTVNAWAGSTVVAWDGSTVNARAGSTVVAWAGSNVVAWDGSNVVARAGSNVNKK